MPTAKKQPTKRVPKVTPAINKETKEKAPRNEKGQFLPGYSGNPSGLPPGYINWGTTIRNAFAEQLAKVDGKTKEPAFVDFLNRFMNEAMRRPAGHAGKFLAERLLQTDVLEQLDTMLNKAKKEDIDFLQYRIHKKAFDEQLACMQSRKRLKLKCAGRRAGKTESNVFEAASVAQNPGSLILIIGLSFGTAVNMYFDKFVDLFADLGMNLERSSKNEGLIVLPNKSEIHFQGNSTIDERNKCRGFKWDLVIIDEAQSQKELRYLVEDILHPTLLDRKGTMILSGSGPRVRGTYWEHLWYNAEDAFKINWNITNNPHIPDYKEVLQKEVIEKRGINPNSALFKREYLGLMDAFDDDALVYRLTEKNYYTDEELQEWIQRQPVTDLHVSGGLDYGFRDSDGFVLILYSDSSPEKFLIYEHKANRSALQTLVEAIVKGIEHSNNFAPLLYIFCDHNEQRITHMLSDTYNLPTMNAYKMHKDMAIEVLQDEVRMGHFKVKKGGFFEEEAMHTVFARDEADNLTRQIDHDSYHPDLIDAVLYALRDYWNWNHIKLTKEGEE